LATRTDAVSVLGDNPVMKPIIFVSCGQVTPAELQLGKDLVRLIEDDGRYSAYFAENQSSFEGVTQNILARLEDAAGFVAVIHPRGDVHVSIGADQVQPVFTRASVWIEQEVAILAMLSQIQKKQVAVQIYSKRGVVREGLRSYVMTNPHEFDDEAQILLHFRGVLAGWTLSRAVHCVALRPIIRREPHDRNPEMSTLRVALHNDGDEQALDARVRMRMPMRYIRHVHIANERRRNTHLEMELERSFFLDQNLFQQLYPNDTTRFVQEIYYYVDASWPPVTDDLFEIEIRSGNAPIFVGRVPLAQLQATAPNSPYMILPAVGDASQLVPFAGA
jgi:hypothetical protein